MKVLVAASEAVPFAKTGGLADVAGVFTNALSSLGHDVRLIMPLYRTVQERFTLNDTGIDIKVPVGKRVYVSRLMSFEDRFYFLSCAELWDREELYGTSAGDYADNAERFVFLCRAMLEACLALDFVPDVIHCNDWQTGLVPLYVKTLYKKHFKTTSTVLTIHNIAYQGLFPASAMDLTGLDWEFFNPDALEFYGQLGFLKGGLVFSDAVTTVSSTYGRELMTEEYGAGLEGVLQGLPGGVTGIINGIDYEQWDPASDGFLPQNFSLDDISGKQECKRSLSAEAGFVEPGRPLLVVVGRLSAQKGIDILLDAAGDLVSKGVNIAVLGKGELALEEAALGLCTQFPGSVFVKTAYDEALAHKLYAAADIFLMPSRYEPCGLTQMIAMRYGAVPVARATGGLNDTIQDYDHLSGRGTGFLFSKYSAEAFGDCVMRALRTYCFPLKWNRIVAAGMKARFSWHGSANKYVALYEGLKKEAPL